MPVSELTAFAYPSFEQRGLPSWARSDRYDIDAKGDPSASQETMARMMRSLLRERFGLQVHYEQKNVRALGLTVSKHPRPDSLSAVAIDCAQLREARTAPPGKPTNGNAPESCAPTIDQGLIFASGGITMEAFARVLSGKMKEPVLDRTGLKGLYRFLVKFMPPGTTLGPGFTVSSDEYPEIPSALREQLGLEFKSIRAGVDVLVIDAVEHPTGN